MSGANSHKLDEEGFANALSRFGIDSPIANVTKRLSYYGNTVEILNLIKEAFQHSNSKEFALSVYQGANVNPLKKVDN
jgi:hypothetical protein